MKKVSPIIIEEWLQKGDEDELNAASILRHRDGTPSGVCFLSQQMAEKYLKGLIIYCNKKPPKVHDLIKLENILAKKFPAIRNLHKELKSLNRYYIETRYPGDFPEFSWRDAEEACEAAKKIKKIVLKSIQ